ncbi:hypothetical protein ACFPA1_08715 [Neobacillus sp. GCM10023253]|uniref:hypothetical protein n=1 Tax=Neobacillus sp. GCM10023253 TaxID=3252644 RepID=UPI0036097433
MKIDVYTYDDPKRWKHHSQFEHIKNAIHICATKNMKDGIVEAYQDDEADEFRNVFTFRELMDELLSEWNSPEDQLKQYLTLSRIIHRYATEKKELKDAFRNNRSEILETIRFLTFTGVKPADFLRIDPAGEYLTEKEKLFHQIWFEVEEQDPTYIGIRKQLIKGWSMLEVKSKLNKILQKEHKSFDYTINKIVLHGFYFVTPEQQIILQSLMKSGFEMTFFNFYDQRFSDTFDFTRAFISEQFQWTDYWVIESNRKLEKETLGTAFLSAFEGEEAVKESTDQEVICYDSFHEFLNQVIIPYYPIGKPKLHRKDVQLIATNADMLNDILVQYYPDKFAESRNFLHYPIGQFISKIHQMIEGSSLVLNEDILISTFSSGWLYNPISKKNARDYTYVLKQLLPFFGNCRNVHDWDERFSDLLRYYDEVIAAFEEPGDNRIVTSVRSPFSKISHFALTKKQVEDVQYFYEQLIFIAQELFDLKQEEASISDHFQKLLTILEERNPIRHSNLLLDEVDIIVKLNEKLKNIKDDNFFLYDDIGEAINVYLSGKLSKSEDPFIKPFIEVDGEAFKKNKTIHLTGLDERGLPLDEFSTPWPLQEDTFEKLSILHEVLELNTLRNKSVKQISRYLLFIALEFLGTIELSWMRNYLDRTNLKPAVYIYQLGLKIKDSREKENQPKIEPRPNTCEFTELEAQSSLEEGLSDLKFADYLIEYNQCPRRFYYSYILNPSPVFIDDFNHQFMFTELIRLVRRSTGLTNQQVIQTVSDLFPQWTDYKKQTIAQTYINITGRGETLEEVSGNTSVSKARKNIQLPGLSNAIRNRLVDNTIENKAKLENGMVETIMGNTATLLSKPGFHCRFCPHLDTCIEGEFPID